MRSTVVHIDGGRNPVYIPFMRDSQRIIPGTTPGKDQAKRNGMPPLRPYRYRAERGLPLHGHQCPECGGKVRPQRDTMLFGVCLGCRAVVELDPS
jgi:hypothetical protein